MSALMKTAFDPAYEDVAGDARHALHRCTTDVEYARWAKIWGGPLCEALLDDETAARADMAEEEATKANQNLREALDELYRVQDLDCQVDEVLLARLEEACPV